MAGSNKDRGRSRRPDVEDWGWSSIGWVLGGRTIERSGDVVCGLHRAQGDEEYGFLGLASKPRMTVSPGLTSKWWLRVPSLSLKTDSYGLMIWASKSP
jgi:hypothetical protein